MARTPEQIAQQWEALAKKERDMDKVIVPSKVQFNEQDRIKADTIEFINPHKHCYWYLSRSNLHRYAEQCSVWKYDCWSRRLHSYQRYD